MNYYFVFKIIQQQPAAFAVACVSWCLHYVMPLLPAFFLQKLYGALELPTSNPSLVQLVLLGWITMHLARVPIAFINQYLDIKFSYLIQQLLYSSIIDHYFTKRSFHKPQPAPAELSYSVRTDIEMVCLYMYWIACIPSQICVTLVAFAPLLNTNLIVCLLLIVLSLMLIGHSSAQFQKTVSIARANTNRDTQEVSRILSDLASQKEMIVLHQRQSLMLMLLRNVASKKRRTLLKEVVTNQLIELLFNFVAQAAGALVILLLSIELKAGKITLPQFVMVLSYLPTVVESAYYVGCYMTNLYQAGVAYQRLCMLTNLDETDHVQPLDLPEQLQVLDITTVIKPPHSLKAYQLRVTIMRHTVTVISGPSNSGKTYLLHDIAGLVGNSHLELRWNGTLVKDRFMFAIPPRISLCPQQAQLFPGTVRDNICRGNCDLKRLEKILYYTGLDKELTNFSNGLDTIIDLEKMPLSGGQAQRIALARTLYQPADIYLLDDVTSALDAESEKLIWQRLLEHPTATYLIATHRTINSAPYADQTIQLRMGQEPFTTQKNVKSPEITF